jgi:hypothetical protein
MFPFVLLLTAAAVACCPHYCRCSFSAFWLFTIFNLAPRAISSHRWYLKHFPNYPKDRKAVIPYLI